MAKPAIDGPDLNDPAVQHMRLDFPRLGVDHTVGEALAAIRENPPENRVIYFYVVDEENHLRGIVPTRRLLMSALDKPIGDIMVKQVITIPHTATIFEACEFFIFHRLLAFPVVDDEGHLLGIVDIELYTEELSDLDRREASDDLFQLVGVHLSDAQKASALAAFRTRFPWLLANIGGGLMAAVISGFFEAELKAAVALALFIPVVLALAESVTIQSVSLALQVLRGRHPTAGDIFTRVQGEVTTGLLLGVVSGIAVAVMALLWVSDSRVVACVLGGIAGGVTYAAAIGVAIPNILRMLHREPQVAAGPVALACTDMGTLVIYFGLARWLIG